MRRIITGATKPRTGRRWNEQPKQTPHDTEQKKNTSHNHHPIPTAPVNILIMASHGMELISQWPVWVSSLG